LKFPFPVQKNDPKPNPMQTFIQNKVYYKKVSLENVNFNEPPEMAAPVPL